MRVMRTVRAAALPALPRLLPDLRPWGSRALVFILCLSAALLLTATRLEITRLRYELSDLYGRKELAAAHVARLGVEAANLSSPQRIEAAARALGFVYPDRKSYLVLDE